jgi:hypothetical protein
MGLQKKNKSSKKHTLKHRKVGGTVNVIDLPKENVIPFNISQGTSVDPIDPSVVVSSRLTPQPSFFGGKKNNKSKKAKKRGKKSKKTKKEVKGGTILDNVFNKDPVSGTSRYDMNEASAFGNVPGSLWSYNQLSAVGNAGGAQLSIQNRPVAMV